LLRGDDGDFTLPAGLTGEGNPDKDITWMFAGKGGRGGDPFAEGQLYKALGFGVPLFNEMALFKRALMKMQWEGRYQDCSL
jgi:hypothetical protein